MDTHTHTLARIVDTCPHETGSEETTHKGGGGGPRASASPLLQEGEALQGEPQGPTEDMAPHAEASETTLFLGILSGPFALQSLAAVHGLVA